jgi:hypothetical protein
MPNTDSGFLSVSAAKAERDRATSSVCARVSVTLVMSSRKGIFVCLCRVWNGVLNGLVLLGEKVFLFNGGANIAPHKATSAILRPARSSDRAKPDIEFPRLKRMRHVRYSIYVLCNVSLSLS